MTEEAYAFAKKRFDRARQALNSDPDMPAMRLTNALTALVPLDQRDLPTEVYALYERLTSVLGKKALSADGLRNRLGAAIDAMDNARLQRAIALLHDAANALDNYRAAHPP